MDLLPVTLDEMLKEIERECALRRRVYPRWVGQGKISQDKADRQIEVMEAIRAELWCRRKLANSG